MICAPCCAACRIIRSAFLRFSSRLTLHCICTAAAVTVLLMRIPPCPVSALLRSREAADHDINEVSGGQLQRACICRSMINKPRLLFADEPTGALNRTSSNEVMDELIKINKEGTTIMMVTHDAKVAAKCSRVLYIVDGNIKGEFYNSKEKTEKERERLLNDWLMDLGW